MINKVIYSLVCFFISIFILSCKSTETIEKIVFDYSQFEKITFLSNVIEIEENYSPTFEDPYIDHLMDHTPNKRLINWINNNIKGVGTENKLSIIIKEASIETSIIESEKKLSGIFKKPDEILYELNYEMLFIMYDDLNNSLGKANVKINRSTTSATLISLDEKDRILNDLVYQGLLDLINKFKSTTKKYLIEYML